MHFHDAAVNVLVYGRRRWYVHPPGRASYSVVPISEWLPRPGADKYTYSCEQSAGDVLFMPHGWSHATLNLKESVGVAFEFETRPVELACH